MSRWDNFTDNELLVIRQEMAENHGDDLAGESPTKYWCDSHTDRGIAALFIVQELTAELVKRGYDKLYGISYTQGYFAGVPLTAKTRKAKTGRIAYCAPEGYNEDEGDTE